MATTTRAAADPNVMDPRVELTLRGVVLGVLITLVFTAANVYLGLRALHETVRRIAT